jgi:hypothetical protein
MQIPPQTFARRVRIDMACGVLAVIPPMEKLDDPAFGKRTPNQKPLMSRPGRKTADRSMPKC